MCTISVVPPQGDRGWRLMVNRDERRTRPMAWPPRMSQVGGTGVMSPVDSLALGTWIAATDEGLGLVVMNVNPARGLAPRASVLSRGTVVPALADAPTAGVAIERLARLPLKSLAAFRVIATNGHEISWGHWDGCTLRTAREALRGPRLFASSTLGDQLVAKPREQLFELLLRQECDPWRAQDRLHLHAWPDRRHLSVNMSRPDACTASRTSVIGSEAAMEMTYVPFLEGWPGPATTRTMSCARRTLAGVA